MVLELERTENNIKSAKEQLDKLTKEDAEVQEKIAESKASLHETKSQEIQAKKDLEEITSRLYNAKHDMTKTNSTSILTNKEKEFIEKQIAKKPETKSIIEAASAVAASLKSKLGRVEKELETVQQLLEKERKEHAITKDKLDKIREAQSQNKS